MKRYRLLGMLVLLAAIAVAASARAQERVQDPQGEFEYLAATGGVLITAPHGTADYNTAPLAISVARTLGTGYVVFRGSRAGAERTNVNRPAEGGGLACANEPETDRARATYDAYVRLVRAAVGGQQPALYVELHGNADPRTAQNIEVASKGISDSDAAVMKDGYPAALAAARRMRPAFPTLTLLVEPLDRIYWTASCLKTRGVLSGNFLPRALHFEFPRAVRESDMLDATAALTVDLLRRVPAPR
ncbi:MAG TPA: hypothetical protein VFM39_03325 [bacterium]|nr:hypothetical protein [bacterium]